MTNNFTSQKVSITLNVRNLLPRIYVNNKCKCNKLLHYVGINICKPVINPLHKKDVSNCKCYKNYYTKQILTLNVIKVCIIQSSLKSPYKVYWTTLVQRYNYYNRVRICLLGNFIFFLIISPFFVFFIYSCSIL